MYLLVYKTPKKKYKNTNNYKNSGLIYLKCPQINESFITLISDQSYKQTDARLPHVGIHA